MGVEGGGGGAGACVSKLCVCVCAWWGAGALRPARATHGLEVDDGSDLVRGHCVLLHQAGDGGLAHRVAVPDGVHDAPRRVGLWLVVRWELVLVLCQVGCAEGVALVVAVKLWARVVKEEALCVLLALHIAVGAVLQHVYHAAIGCVHGVIADGLHAAGGRGVQEGAPAAHARGAAAAATPATPPPAATTTTPASALPLATPATPAPKAPTPAAKAAATTATTPALLLAALPATLHQASSRGGRAGVNATQGWRSKARGGVQARQGTQQVGKHFGPKVKRIKYRQTGENIE